MTDMRQAPDAPPRRRSDGEATHAAILAAAMRLASVEGLASLTIGRLARELGVSKSGVFAHFRSKQRLQLETIAAAGEVFEREVLRPGLEEAPGVARLQALCEAYLSYIERGVFPGGCFFAQLLAEYDAQSGVIHEQVSADHHGWLQLLAGEVRAAQHLGELDGDVDPLQLAFELSAPVELANYLSVLFRDGTHVERGRRAVRDRIVRAGV